MTLVHNNRIRKQGGKQVIRDVLTTQKEPTPPADDEIRRRAYEVYMRRVQYGLPGDAATDWLAAERELREGEKRGHY